MDDCFSPPRAKTCQILKQREQRLYCSNRYDGVVTLWQSFLLSIDMEIEIVTPGPALPGTDSNTGNNATVFN